MTNQPNTPGHRADLILTDEAQAIPFDAGTGPDQTHVHAVRMPRKAHLQAMFSLLLGASLAPTVSTHDTAPPLQPIKPPRHPKRRAPVEDIQPPPTDDPEEQAAREALYEVEKKCMITGCAALAANDLMIIKDGAQGWITTYAPLHQHPRSPVNVIARLATYPNHTIAARVSPKATVRQRRAVVRWVEMQESAAVQLRSCGLSLVRYELGAGLPLTEAPASPIAPLLPWEMLAELVALPRLAVRDNWHLYTRPSDPARLTQFRGLDPELEDPRFVLCAEDEADVWSYLEGDDLRALVARAFSDSLEVVELPGVTDL